MIHATNQKIMYLSDKLGNMSLSVCVVPSLTSVPLLIAGSCSCLADIETDVESESEVVAIAPCTTRPEK